MATKLFGPSMSDMSPLSLIASGLYPGQPWAPAAGIILLGDTEHMSDSRSSRALSILSFDTSVRHGDNSSALWDVSLVGSIKLALPGRGLGLLFQQTSTSSALLC